MSRHQTRFRLTLHAVACVAVFATVPAIARERLADPGFETARLSMTGGVGTWRPNGDVARVKVSREPQALLTGHACVQMDSAAGGEAQVYQSIGAVKPGEQYVLRVWARGRGDIILQAYQYGADGKWAGTPYDTPRSLGAAWKQYEWAYTVPVEVVSIAPAIHTRGGVAFLDDASFRPVGEEPGEEVVNLSTFTVRGGVAERGRARIPAGYLQDDSPNLLMEAEHASSLRFYGAGQATEMPGAVGLAVSYLSGLTFDFAVKQPDRYRAWYRVWVPFNAPWSHSERMDGGKENANEEDDTRPGDKPKHPAKSWYWVAGPTYPLTIGRHRWEFLNWHGGIALDRVLLTANPDFTPEGEGGPEATRTAVGTAEAVTPEVKPLSVRKWKALTMASRPGGGALRCSFSTDKGKTWQALPLNGNLTTIPAKGDGSDSLKFRVELLPGPTGQLPEFRDAALHYFVGRRNELTLEGAKVRLTFRGAEGAIAGLYNKERKVYCSSPESGAPLFVLGVHRAQPDGQKRLDEVPSTAGVLESAEVAPAKNGKELRFSYLMEEGQVRVRGWLRADNTEILRGRLGIENNSTNDVIAVSFPLLSGLAVAGDGQDDILALPYVQGRFIRNPAAESFGYPRYFTWPGGLSMAWMDLFDPANNTGLYLSCYDAKAGTTEFLPQPAADKASFGLGIRKWLRAKPGEKWESPEVIVGLHSGDWHWAADRYREWARSWLRPTNPPRWFRESEGFFEGFPLHSGDFVDQPYVVDNGLRSHNLWYLAWAQMCDATGCCGLFPYPCPLLGSKDEFRWSNDRIHERGGFTGYYIGASIWNPAYTKDAKCIGNTPTAFMPPDERDELKDTDFFKRVRVVEPDGQAPPDVVGEGQVDAAAKEWRDHLVHWTMRYLTEFGADGIYFDHLGIQVAWPSVNYVSHTGPDEWGRSQMAMLKEIKTRGRALNPDTLFAMEGCADIYFQDADMGLLSGSNGMELFRYTFPETIHGGGASSGTTLSNTLRNVFMLGYKMEVPWFTDVRSAKEEPWGPKVAAIRRTINPFLFSATFRDTVGILKCGSDRQQYDAYSDKVTLDARLFLCNEPGNRAALVTINNRAQAEGQQIVVDTAGWGPVKVAWSVAPEAVQSLKGTQKGSTFTFAAPKDFYSAVLLINECEPLVSVRDVPRVGAAGAAIRGPVYVRNLGNEPIHGFVEIRAPKGYQSEKLAFGPVLPGEQVEQQIHFVVDPKADLGRVDLECVGTVGGQVVGRELHSRPGGSTVQLSHNKTGSTAWVIPFRVIRPIVAILERAGRDRLELILENHASTKLTGQARLTITGGLRAEPSQQTYSVATGQTERLSFTYAQLPALATRELARATVAYPGGEAVALRSVRPGVLNGSFEDDSVGEGYPDWFNHYEMQVFDRRSIGKFDDTVAFTGKRSWRLDPGDHLYTWLARGRPRTKYRFSCAIRRSVQDQGIGVHLTPAADPWPSIAIGHTDKAALNEWEVYDATFTSGDSGRTLLLQLMGSSKGPVWFDNVRLEEE